MMKRMVATMAIALILSSTTVASDTDPRICEYALEDGLIVRFSETLQNLSNTTEKVINWELIYEGEAWIGLGFSPNGEMIGATVVIGFPHEELPTSVYYLAAKTTQGLVSQEADESEFLLYLDENEAPSSSVTPNSTSTSSSNPTTAPSVSPTTATSQPTSTPTDAPSKTPSVQPTSTEYPTKDLSVAPTLSPAPSFPPSITTSSSPTASPTVFPTTATPTDAPSKTPPNPTLSPTLPPTTSPTQAPSRELPAPTPRPTRKPTLRPTRKPTPRPTRRPTPRPTRKPTPRPTRRPTPRETPSPVTVPTPRTYEAPVRAPSWLDEWLHRQLEEPDDHTRVVLHTQRHVLEQNDTHSILSFMSTATAWHVNHDLIYAVGSSNTMGYHATRGMVNRTTLLSMAHCINDDSLSAFPSMAPTVTASIAPSQAAASTPVPLSGSATLSPAPSLVDEPEDDSATSADSSLQATTSSVSGPNTGVLSLTVSAIMMVVAAASAPSR